MKYNSPTLSKADWTKIKYDFVTNGCTMRSLSRKYNLAVSTISKRAKKEGWVKLAEQVSEQVEQQSEQIAIKKAVSNNEKAMQIIDALMNKMQEAVKNVNVKDVSAMKSLVTSMKDLRDIGVFEVKHTEGEGIKIEMGGTDEYAD